MADRVFIEGLRVSGVHGVHAHERRAAQEFIVDVSMECNARRAGQSDLLKDALDYGSLRAIVQEVIGGLSCNLLEHLAETIATKVLVDRAVSSVTVSIRKSSVYDDCVPGVSLTRIKRQRLL